MRKLGAAVALAGAVFLPALTARAAAIVDQANNATPQQNYNIGFFTLIGQEFQPTQTGLDFVDLRVEDADSSVGPGCNLRVAIHSGTIGGTIVGTSQTVLVPDAAAGFFRFPFPSTVSLTPNTTYVMETQKLSSDSGFMQTEHLTDSYSRGRPIRSGNPVTTPEDFLFQTGRNTAALPRTGATLAPFAYSGIEDTDGGGSGDVFMDSAFINAVDPSFTPHNVRKAMFEYDVTGYSSPSITSATVSGTLHVNNALDTGVRTINVQLYTGDGVMTLGDFNIASTAAGSFSYHPPTDSQVAFSIDVTSQVKSLLTAGAQFVGVRYAPANTQAPSVFVDFQQPTLTIAVPEPGTIALLALAAPLVLRRRR